MPWFGGNVLGDGETAEENGQSYREFTTDSFFSKGGGLCDFR
jgi:hypothetical protein